MTNFRSIQVVCSFVFIYPFQLFSADVAPCQVAPGSSAKIVKISCPMGDSKTTIDSETATEIESDETYHLVFKDTLFNRKRTVRILDTATQVVALTIEVSEPHQAVITSEVEDKTWIFEGLEKADLSHLEIKTHGKLIVKDSLEIDSALKVTANSLYWLQPFSIKKGTFFLKYEEGFVSRLNFPFQSRIDNDSIVLESLGTINSPSKRRVSLKGLENESLEVPLEDLVAAYYASFQRQVTDDYPHYQNIRNAKAKRAFLRVSVFPLIADNSKKGIIGESLYKSYMTRTFPGYEFRDPKVGLNSFDAIYVGRENPAVPLSAIKELFITEVKYASHGSPVLGVRKIADREWRQLSLPYIQSVLADMVSHSAATKSIAQLVEANRPTVKLRLAVFDPGTFKMVLYQVGTLEKSLLD